MINLYQKEVEDITACVEKVSKKYWGREANGENLNALHNELKGRLADLGFLVYIDVSPVLRGDPVSVAIEDRIDPVGVFDMEKRQHELQEMAKNNENRPDIEGNV